MKIKITFAPKRKSRYFFISYGFKIDPVAVIPTPGITAPPKPIPLAGSEIKNGHGPNMTFASLSVTLDPDEKTNDKVPFISRKQVAGLVQEQHPDLTHMAIINVQELSKNDFTDWNA